MAKYTSRTYAERKKIQEMWKAGRTVKEIADALSVPLSSIYAELRRGRDGTRLPDQRMNYSADTAQLRFQRSIEKRGRKSESV